MHDLYRQSRLENLRKERMKEMDAIAETKDVKHLVHLQPSQSIQRKLSKVDVSPMKP